MKEYKEIHLSDAKNKSTMTVQRYKDGTAYLVIKSSLAGQMIEMNLTSDDIKILASMIE